MILQRVVLVGVLLLTFGLAACGDDDDPSPEEAREDLCQSLDDLRSELNVFDNFSLDSNMDDVEDAIDDVEDDFDDVREDAEDVADAEIDQLQSAIEDFRSSIEGIGDSDTIGAAIDSVQTAAQAVGAAWDELTSIVGCS